MKRKTLLPVMLLAGSIGLTGCFSSTRIVQQTQAPDLFRSATVETVMKDIQDRNAKIQTLNSSVLITATTGGGRTGKETVYTSLKGYIFIRKPRDLRVLLQLPVFGSRALDMVSNGDGFTLMHTAPPGHPDVWMQGSNIVTKPSANGLENLRPPVFFDSLLIAGPSEDEVVTMHESTRLIQPTDKHKPVIEEPDYDLTVMKKTARSGVLQTERVIHISRVNMLPYQQDIYDDKGVQIVTTATYDKYQDAGGVEQFPMLINISRPLDQYELKIEVTKLTLNQKLEDDQFQLPIPSGVTVQKMQ
jgi:outer membrane lipoprotein-sorting protein